MSKTLKEIWEGIKAQFNTPPPAAPATPPAAPPAQAPGAMAAKTYKLQDGVTEISISQAGDIPAVGDMVTINGAAAPGGTHVLADGSSITVDATGAITVYTAAPAAPPATPPAAPPAQPVTLSIQTPEEVAQMYAKFLNGTPEERLGNLEIMMKAVMEYCYGYKIREGQENTAIQVYKDTVATATPVPSVTIEQMNSAFADAKAENDKHIKTIEEQQKKIDALFQMVETLVDQPNADPVTLTGTRRDKFADKKKENESRLDRMSAHIKNMRGKTLPQE